MSLPIDLPALPPPPPFGRAMRAEFALADGITYLNHGAYGGVPRLVAEAQRAWQDRIERNPTAFFRREARPFMRLAAARLAAYLGCDADGLALIDNATSGCNTVLRSLELQPGDEIVFASQTYNAVRNAILYVCARTGAVPVEAALPFPAHGAAAIVEAYGRAIGARARLVVVDHISSQTATVMPLAEITDMARSRGARVLVDGAHAPGHVPLDLASLPVDWYTGNCHKWLCAPRGCAFLWTAPAHRETTQPLTVSHGYGQGYAAEFDWTGTRDFSALLIVGAVLTYRERLGDAAVMSHNTALARRGGELLAAAWRTETGAADTLIGAMQTVRLPIPGIAKDAAARRLQDVIAERHGVEVPVFALAGAYWVRVSAQVHNEIAGYERLAEAIRGDNALAA